MKKIIVIILFLFLISQLSAFSKSRFFDLEYGDYKCIKDGMTCDYYIYESGSGGHGEACPKPQKGVHPDVHFDELANLLSSKYCHFTPTKIEKYECNYNFGHITVYRQNGKVFSVSGNFPDYLNIQNTYNPSNCKLVPMKHH